jgi:putative transposase
MNSGAPDTAWPHAPAHRLGEAGVYMVTAGTYRKIQHFNTPQRLDVLQRGLLAVCQTNGWQLEAWAVFANHYHFIGISPRDQDDASSLTRTLGGLHAKTAAWVNRLDGTPGRKVWHNFFETKLTHEKSYLARLGYVHRNAVRHGLVRVAVDYPWCSASWFERTATTAQVATIYRFKTDRVNVPDEYDVAIGE